MLIPNLCNFCLRFCLQFLDVQNYLDGLQYPVSLRLPDQPGSFFDKRSARPDSLVLLIIRLSSHIVGDVVIDLENPRFYQAIDI